MARDVHSATDELEAALLGGLRRFSAAVGEVGFPAVPGLLGHYVSVLDTLFGAVGRKLEPLELERVRSAVQQALSEAHESSPFSRISVKYKTLPRSKLGYKVIVQKSTAEVEYSRWVETRTPPFFGSHADAKARQLASSLGAPSTVTILDAGAGTGRNTIPLAKLGFATDAVELAPPLLAVLRKDLELARLPQVRVFEGDLFEPSLALPRQHYRLLLLAEVVSSHFTRLAQLRQLFELAQELLLPDGLLAFSVFLAVGEYIPSRVVRQLSQAAWCSVFTREELAQAAQGLPFELLSDESVLEFERAHLPPDAWPPTGWFEQWASGQDLFEMPGKQAPLELRWLVYRSTRSATRQER